MCACCRALIEETGQNISTLQIIKEEEQERKASKPNAINKTIASNDIKLRRPNTPQNSPTTQNNHANVSKIEKPIDHPGNQSEKPMDHPGNQFEKPIDQSSNQSKKPIDNAGIKDQQNQRFKYNTVGNTDQSKGNNGYSMKANMTWQNYNRNQNNVINRTNNNKDRSIDNNANIRDKSYNTDKNQSFQRQNNKKSPPHNSLYNKQNVNERKNSFSSNSNTDDDLAFNKDTYLSNKEFTEVEITVPLDNNEYWITKLKDVEERRLLMIELQTVANQSRNVKPIIGDIYGVIYESIWHRAMVISLNPITVHFIDFGNDEILEKNAKIRDIGDTFKNVPKLARKIQLTPITNAKYKNLQFGDKISIRMLSMNTDGTIIVEAQNQSEDSSVRVKESTPQDSDTNTCTKESVPQSDVNNAMEKTVPQEKFKIPPIINIKASKIQVPNVLNTLTNLLTQEAITELESEGMIHIIESTQMNVYSATLCPGIYSNELSMVIKDLQEECEDMKKKSMNCG